MAKIYAYHRLFIYIYQACCASSKHRPFPLQRHQQEKINPFIKIAISLEPMMPF